MKSGSINGVFGLVRNPAREKIYIFPEQALYRVRHVVAVRSDDPVGVRSFGEIEKLGEDGTIISLNESAPVKYLTRQEADLKIDSVAKNVEGTLHMLLTDRGRFVYCHDLGPLNTIKRMGLEDMVKILPVTFRDDTQTCAFSEQCSVEAMERGNRAGYALKRTGELEEIVRKYRKF